MPVDAPVKVSVVVPVYNPGAHIEALIESLRRQSMPATEFEAVFVDDGSTDATPARLDALAAETPNVRVVHQPNSGWPSKPRNVGIEMARGEFLFFADNDDYLSPEALERMYAYATENDSDVVVPKLVGHGGRGVPWELFRFNRPRARLGHDPLLTILTPHKLFRRSMVLEHGIRFPEGRVRLEDHYFVMKAFFAARVISVLADYTCYHWTRRETGTNATYLPVEPKVYYDSVRAVLDVVEQNTEPGDLRDQLYAHWYHSKILRRLCGKSMAAADADHRRRTFDEVHGLVLERFGDGVDRYLAARDKAQSALLRAGSYDRFFALADAERGVTLDTQIQRLAWEDGRLVLGLCATLVYADRSPVLFRSDGEHVSWVLPIAAEEVHPSALDVTRHARGVRADVAVRDRDSYVRHYVPTEFEQLPWRPGVAGPLRIRLEAVIDPATAAGGDPIGETTDLLVRVAGCGWGPFVRPPMEDLPATETRSGGWNFCVYGTEGYNRISIRKRSTAERGSLDMAKTSQAHAADEVHSWARRSGDRVHLVLRLPGVDLERGTEPTIELKRGGTTAAATAAVTSTADDTGTTLTADAPVGELGTGTWRLALRLPGEDQRRRIDARLLLPRRGPIALLTGPPPGRSLQPRPRGGSVAGRAVRTVGKATDAVLRELPPEQAVRYRRALRRVARSVRG
ncbi:MAG TPA: glycosyltransferase family A protein [Streptosporangiales bacterium]